MSKSRTNLSLTYLKLKYPATKTYECENMCCACSE